MVIEKDKRDMLLVWNNVYEFSAHALLSQRKDTPVQGKK